MQSIFRTGLRAGALVAGLALLTACQNAAKPTEAEARITRAALLEGDRAFAALAGDQGIVQAYSRYLADDVLQLPDGSPPIYGKLAVMENARAIVAEDEFSLAWEPLDAVVALSGELGYTWGNYELGGVDEFGELYSVEGKYVSIWRLRANGDWQVILDISNQNDLPFAELMDWDLDVEAADTSVWN